MAHRRPPSEPWPAARPLLKWTGGKSAELPIIRRLIPEEIGRYIEPFVGGGALLFAMPSSQAALANDFCQDLITLYKDMAALNPLFMEALSQIERCWLDIGEIAPTQPEEGVQAAASAVCASATLLPGWLGEETGRHASAGLRRKRAFLAKLEGQPRDSAAPLLEAAIKSGLYTALRAAYNRAEPGPVRSALFWFMREFAYGGMFRTNASGGFNIPYGGISYNGRSMSARVEQLQSAAIRARMQSCEFHNLEFQAFLDLVKPQPDDFVFLDPPYDSVFSSYDGNHFRQADHVRLASCLAGLSARWMMVIAATPFTEETYTRLPGVHTSSFDKTYQGHILGRNDRNARHLVIANYDLPAAPTLP